MYGSSSVGETGAVDESVAAAEATDAAASVPMRLIAGSPSPLELAAARAVLEQAVIEQRDEHEQLVGEGTTAWQRSQRPLRMPLTPGPGRWNARF